MSSSNTPDKAGLRWRDERGGGNASGADITFMSAGLALHLPGLVRD